MQNAIVDARANIRTEGGAKMSNNPKFTIPEICAHMINRALDILSDNLVTELQLELKPVFQEIYPTDLMKTNYITSHPYNLDIDMNNSLCPEEVYTVMVGRFIVVVMKTAEDVYSDKDPYWLEIFECGLADGLKRIESIPHTSYKLLFV